MFLFRRITEEDEQFKFITGNKAFDELTPNGSLKNYIKQDTINGGKYLTYLLIERQESGNELLGLLRFRYTTIKEFLEQLSIASVSKDIKKNIEKLFSLKKYQVVYLSRIGISEKYHEMRVSQIISNFFEFLIQRKKKDVIIYAKILEDLISVIGSKYRVLGKMHDDNWGNYCLVSKIMEFLPEKE